MLELSCRRPNRRSRLSCEPLEDRRLLATLVGNEADLLNALAGADPCIQLTADIPLSATVNIDRAVTIDGDGFQLMGNGTSRVLTVSDNDGVVDSIAVELMDLTVTGGGGTGVGAGIFNVEELTLTGVTIVGNTAIETNTNYLAAGGGVATDGTLVLDASVITGNTVSTPAGYGNTAIGGGIAAEGPSASVTLLNGSSVDDNVAKGDGGGISIREASLTIVDSSVSGNESGVGANPDTGANGAGIAVNGAGPDGYGGTSFTQVSVELQNATIANNTATSEAVTGNQFPQGGGLFISATGNVNIADSTFEGNALIGIENGSSVFARGGGMALISGSADSGQLNVSVQNSVIEGNQSRDAGGVYSRGYNYDLLANFSSTSISYNTSSGDGGAWFNWAVGGNSNVSQITLQDSTIDGNMGASGGGLFNIIDGTMLVEGGSISNNYATGRGGALSNVGFGSPAYTDLRNVTVANNSAPFVGGAYTGQNGTLRVEGSTITGNMSTGAGGGISSAFSGFAYIYESSITGNSATAGAGVYNFVTGSDFGGRLVVHDSTIAGNYGPAVTNNGFSLTNPGAVVPFVGIYNSTISNNITYSNAAVDSYDGNTTIFQSTISGNEGSSAIEQNTAYGYTGTPMEGMLNVSRTTITENTGSFAIYGNFYARGTLADSLITGNNNLLGFDLYSYYQQIYTSYSLLQYGGYGVTNGVDGNITGVAANLGPLANNGGPTLTHYLYAGSPGVDVATPGAGAGEADQRGATPRDYGGRMDMGAVEFGATIVTNAACDFDGDGDCDADDLNALTTESAAQTNNAQFDLNNDSLVNFADIEEWLGLAGALNTPCGAAYLVGDANLDGSVDGQDFIAWNSSKFTNTPLWSNGNFNGDGAVDGQDFIAWNTNKFTSSCVVASITPNDAGPQAHPGSGSRASMPAESMSAAPASMSTSNAVPAMTRRAEQMNSSVAAATPLERTAVVPIQLQATPKAAGQALRTDQVALPAESTRLAPFVNSQLANKVSHVEAVEDEATLIDWVFAGLT